MSIYHSHKKQFLVSVIPSQKLFNVPKCLCKKPLSTLPSLRNYKSKVGARGKEDSGKHCGF